MGVVVTTGGFGGSVVGGVLSVGVWGWLGAGDKAVKLSVGGGIVPINQLSEAICVH
jgi:hypothetical protein